MVLKYPTQFSVFENNIEVDFDQIQSMIQSIQCELDKIGQGKIVALCLERSANLICGCLACFYSENTFVIVPSEVKKGSRYFDFLHSIKIDLLIIDNKSEIDFNAPRINISKIKKSHLPLGKNDIEIKVNDDKPAYIIATSGSTGTPKAAIISRKSLALYIQTFIEYYGISENEKMFWLSAPYFDMSINHIFIPFFASAKVIAAPDLSKTSINQLLQIIIKSKATFLNIVPSLASIYIKSLNQKLNSLRVLMFGGEKLESNLVLDWLKWINPDCKIYNCYGVSEATVTSFCNDIDTGELQKNSVIPIGKPLPNVKFEIGEEGELIIQGLLVGSGYLNQSSEPFKIVKNLNSYYTGDKVEIVGENLLYIGRIDRMIKLTGGFRLDPREIEELLKVEFSLSFVEYGQFEGKLYVVYHSANKIDENKIKKAIDKKFGIKFLPAVIRKMNKNHLSETGKIDLSKLIGLNNSNKHLSGHFNLEQIWKNVLQIQEFNKSDSFFDLGGDSLKILELESLLSTEFGGKVDVSDLIINHRFVDQINFLLTTDNSEQDQLENRITSYSKDIFIIDYDFILPNINSKNDLYNFFHSSKVQFKKMDDDRFQSLIDKEVLDFKPVGTFFINEFINKLSKNKNVEDLQAQLIVECAERLIENNEFLKNKRNIGVYIGAGPTYQIPSLSNKNFIKEYTPSFISGQINSKYDFVGPSLVIDTACSSSLVAIEKAFQDLKSGVVDFAICGGVQLFSSAYSFLAINNANIYSKSGTCLPFGEKRDGYVPCEGVGLILLSSKIKSKIVLNTVKSNHDGQTTSVGMPSGKSQRELLLDSLQEANLTPKDIDIIESHSTGTVVGDPVEFETYKSIFGNGIRTPKIGAFKANFGHPHYSSGALGIIKMIVQLEQGEVFKLPNYPLSKRFSAQYFPRNSSNKFEPNSTGIVCSFGLSGTNACAILSKLNITDMYDLKKIISDKLGHNIDVKKSFMDNDIDSVDMVELADYISLKLDIEIPINFIFNSDSIEGFIKNVTTLLPNNIAENSEHRSNFDSQPIISPNDKNFTPKANDIDFTTYLKFMSSFYEIQFRKEDSAFNKQLLNLLQKQQSELFDLLHIRKHFAESNISEQKSQIKNKLIQIISEVTDLPNVIIDDNMDLNNEIGSLHIIEIIERINQAFDAKFTYEEFLDIKDLTTLTFKLKSP